jgi:16S rRNA (guanine(527)-N(7))-methyltransferase RsmG
LFHVEQSHLLWARCTEWAAGRELSPAQLATLDRYREWLLTEAVEAGGIGPNEAVRIDNRHIGDSLLFAGGFRDTPRFVLDVGSGVGLPGIPLSIVMPDTRFALLDRSGRRVDLMRRVARMLDLPNVEVVHGDISDWRSEVDGIVSRASLSPEQALVSFSRILGPAGTAVVGGSWAAPPVVVGFDLLEVPGTVLDQKVWLLIMRPQ